MVVLDMPGNKYPEGPLGFQANFAHSNHRIFQQLGLQISATKTIRCVLFHFEPFEHEAPKVSLPPRCFLWTSWTLLQQVHDMALLTLSSCLVLAQGTSFSQLKLNHSPIPKKMHCTNLCWLVNPLFDFKNKTCHFRWTPDTLLRYEHTPSGPGHPPTIEDFCSCRRWKWSR